MTDEEKGYEIIDKRASAQDGAEKSPEEEPAAEADTPESEQPGDGLPPVDVFTLLASFIGMLGAQAWQWMGLVKNPSTGNIEKDLAQAKVAIDAIAALAAQLEGKISAAEAEELKAMISDLRINFVRQS